MIRTKKDLYYYLERDRIAMGIPPLTFSRWIIQLIFVPKIWVFVKTLRKAEYYTNVEIDNHLVKIIFFIIRIYYLYLFRHRSLQLGFSIPINVFGPGLSIPHYGTIVVNGACKIGSNCRLHAGVNIGASAGKKTAPKIGNNVYIGPGTIIFGDIQIADNVTIGANATVNKSCLDENVVLAGTPARIVKTNSPNWLEFNNIK